MNKTTPTSGSNPWDDAAEPAVPVVPARPRTAKAAQDVKTVREITSPDFDIDGLMTDFPTATELERFVFDQTGAVLNLKGRANKLKYQVAMDVLNGTPVEPKYIGEGNPYLDKADLVPEEPHKTLPHKTLLARFAHSQK